MSDIVTQYNMIAMSVQDSWEANSGQAEIETMLLDWPF